jgi:membrane protein DedA with SNARE-associated domain
MNLQVYVEPIIAFVQEHRDWAMPIVFALAFGESLAFISLLLPSTVILVAISGLLGASGIDFIPVWFCAGIGGALGYWLSYFFGYHYRDQIQGFWPFKDRPEMLPRGQRFFEKYGILGVFLGHFFGPIRAVIPVVAGMYSMKQVPFQIANFSSSFLWAAGVLAPGTLGVRFLTG